MTIIGPKDSSRAMRTASRPRCPQLKESPRNDAIISFDHPSILSHHHQWPKRALLAGFCSIVRPSCNPSKHTVGLHFPPLTNDFIPPSSHLLYRFQFARPKYIPSLTRHLKQHKLSARPTTRHPAPTSLQLTEASLGTKRESRTLYRLSVLDP